MVLEEPLCRVEIIRNEKTGGFMARIYSEYDGVREFRHRELDPLLRELTIDLEASYGETMRNAGPEQPATFDEEGPFLGDEMA